MALIPQIEFVDSDAQRADRERAHQWLCSVIAAAYRSGFADAEVMAKARGHTPPTELSSAARTEWEQRIARLAESLARQAERGKWP